MKMLNILLFIALISNVFGTEEVSGGEVTINEPEPLTGRGDWNKGEGDWGKTWNKKEAEPECEWPCNKNEICVHDYQAIPTRGGSWKKGHDHNHRRLTGGGPSGPWDKSSKSSPPPGICVSRCDDECSDDEECVLDEPSYKHGKGWSKGHRRLTGSGRTTAPWEKTKETGTKYGWDKPEPTYSCQSKCRHGWGCDEMAFEECVPKKYKWPTVKPPAKADRRRLNAPPDPPQVPQNSHYWSKPEREYECKCVDGYYYNKWYKECQVKCDGGCGEHGSCSDKPTLKGYQCICEFGWEGKKCDKETDFCPAEKNPCPPRYHPQRTLCIPKADEPGYKCVSPCSGVNNQCKNDGLCVNTRDDSDGFVCLCDCPWRGDLCQYECINNIDCGGENWLCKNNECECPDPFIMDDSGGCTRPDPCADRFCQNGDCTLSSEGEAVCMCDDGWENAVEVDLSTPCTVDVDECDIDPPFCKNGGTCTDQPNGKDPVCCCIDRFEGPTCDISGGPIPGPCDDPDTNPCADDGVTICTNIDPGVAECSCPDGYSMPVDVMGKKKCFDFNECDNPETNNCVEGACINLTPPDGKFKCKCPAGSTGDGIRTTEGGTGCTPIGGGNTPSCEDNDDCDENARCTRNKVCKCKEGYKGDGTTTGSGCRKVGGGSTGGGGGGKFNFRKASSSDSSDSRGGGGGKRWKAQSALSDNYLSDDNEYNNDNEYNGGDSVKAPEMKYTLDISPWILYVSSGLIIAFIALNYALCYYRSISKKNKNGDKLRYDEDEKIPLSDDA